MKANKKGVSLAFVIVVVLALVILSSLLFTAAAHSMSMTGRSTEGRAAYLKAKSAIEYAKTEVYDLAKSNTLDTHIGFSIGPSGDYFQLIVAQAPNGTTCLAECAPAADGKTWKITAKVKYTGLEQYQQMSYSFTLTQEQHKSAPVCLPASDFLAAGVGYGKKNVFDNNGFWPEMLSQTASDYPAVEHLPIAVSGNPTSVTAPEILLMGDTNLQQWGGSDSGHYSLVCENGARGSICSDRICIGSDIYTPFTSYKNQQNNMYVVSSMAVVKLCPNTQGATTGVIYFAGNNGGNCTVKRDGTDGPFKANITIPSGYYSFEAGFDICSIVADPHSNAAFLDSYGGSGAKRMVKLSDTASINSFQQDIAYTESFFADNQLKIISGARWSGLKGANFESDGVFADQSTSPSFHNGNHWNVYNNGQDYNLDENAVFTYATITGWPASATWPQYKDAYGNIQDSSSGTYNIYCAKQFFLRFVSSTNQFTLPASYNIVFHSDLVALSMSKTDTDVGTDADHRPKIVQANNASSSQFLLTSLSKDGSGNYKNVTLAVQNDIKVVYSGESYIIPSGVYSVPSGFNFFDTKFKTKEDWAGFWSGCREGDYSPSGSGSGSGSGSPGTPGSFTVTPGQYSVS